MIQKLNQPDTTPEDLLLCPELHFRQIPFVALTISHHHCDYIRHVIITENENSKDLAFSNFNIIHSGIIKDTGWKYKIKDGKMSLLWN